MGNELRGAPPWVVGPRPQTANRKPEIRIVEVMSMGVMRVLRVLRVIGGL